MATLYVGSEQTYKTLAEAVAAASAGDTVIVKGSEYSLTDERVRVDKSLTLKAEGDVTLRGLNIGGANFDLVVDGFNFVADENDTNTGYADNASCIAQVGQLRNVTVQNCSFDISNAGHTRTYGMYLSLGTWGFENLVVVNNTCDGMLDEGWSGYGLIYAANVNNANISGNTITDVAANAIQLSLTGKEYQGTGEQTVVINGNNISNVYSSAIYCADLHNSNMTVEISKNIVSDALVAGCGIYTGAIRIGASTISGVEITDNIVEGALVGIYSGALIKEGGSVEISGNALAVSQTFPAEEGVTPEFSGLRGDGIPAGAAELNMVVEGSALPASDVVGSIYVDAVWAGFEAGSKVAVDGKVAVVGTNAFGSFVDALKNVTADTAEIAVSGNVTEDIPAESMSVVLSKDLEISGSDAVITLNNGGYNALVFESAADASDVTVNFNGVQLVAPRTQVFFGNAVDGEDGAEVLTPVKAVVDASSLVSAYIIKIETGSTVDVLEGGKFFSTGEVMNVSGTLNATGNAAFDPAAETLTADDRQIVAHYMWNYGTVALADNYSTVYSQLRLIGSDAVMTLDNARLDVGVTVAGDWLGNPASNGVGWVRIGGGTELALTNDSVMKASGANAPGGYGLTVDADGAFTVASGSSAEFGAGVINNGVVNVNNGSLTVGSKFVAFQTGQPVFDFVNNGTFTVSGTSTLDIATVTGNSVRLADGAVIKDSTIGGTVVADGNVTFEGANTVATLGLGYYNHTVTIGAGSSLAAIGGSRTTLSYGNTLDVDGSIVDAKTAVADKANMTASLNIAAGLSFTGNANYNGKNAVLDVDNAYVSFGGSTSKNSAANGDFVFNFDNSIVDFTAEFKIVASTVAGLNPTFQLTVTDSVFTVARNFALAHANVTAVFDNSIVNANACFKNSGSTTLVDGTVMTVKSNGDGPARENTGNFGTLSITSGSVFDITSGTVAVADAFYNAGTVEVKTNGTFQTTYFNNLNSIVVDGTSTFIAKEILGEGTITIDAANFAGGVLKVIDLSGNASIEDMVTVENLAAGVKVVYGDDGDVVLSDIANESFYVDAAFTGNVGDEIAEGKFMDVNAFASLGDALDAADETISEIVVSSSTSEALSGKTISGNIVAAGNAVTVADSANDNYVNIENAVIGENVTIGAAYFYLLGENTIDGNIVSATTFYSSAKKTVINGTATVYTTMSRRYSAMDEGIYIVGNAEAGQAVDAAVQYKSVNYIGHYSGTFSIKNTAVEAGYLLLNNTNDNANGDGLAAKIVLDNAYLATIGGPNTQPGQFLMNGDAIVELTNKSVLDISGPGEFGYLGMTSGVITVDDSTFIMGREGQGTNTVGGTINVVNGGSVISLGKVINNGTINIVGNSLFTATMIENANGTITIDATGITEMTKVVDVNAAISGTLTVENLEVGMGYVLAEDGDVIIVELGVIKVDAAFAGKNIGEDLGDGFYFGVNAFAGLSDITDAASQGIRKVIYTSSETGSMTLTVSASEFTTYSIAGENSYVKADRTQDITMAVETGQEYIFEFTNETGDFALSSTFNQVNGTEEIEDLDAPVADDEIAVAPGTGAKSYEFSVAAGTTADFHFSLETVDGKISFSLVDGEGNVVYSSRTMGNFSHTIEDLAAGDYTFAVDTYAGDNSVYNFDASFTVNEIKVVADTLISTADDTKEGSVAVTFANISGENEYANWVGAEDGEDWIEITDFTAGRVTFTLEVEDGSSRTTAAIYSQVGEGRLRQVRGWSTSSSASATLTLAADTKYYVQICSNGDSSYTMQLA